MKKYELTSETKIVFGHILYRIKALSSFGYVSAGDLGGFLESEKNLSQNEMCIRDRLLYLMMFLHSNVGSCTP